MRTYGEFHFHIKFPFKFYYKKACWKSKGSYIIFNLGHKWKFNNFWPHWNARIPWKLFLWCEKEAEVKNDTSQWKQFDLHYSNLLFGYKIFSRDSKLSPWFQVVQISFQHTALLPCRTASNLKTHFVFDFAQIYFWNIDFSRFFDSLHFFEKTLPFWFELIRIISPNIDIVVETPSIEDNTKVLSEFIVAN